MSHGWMEGNHGGPELGDPTYHWAWVAGQTVNKLELEAVGLVGVVAVAPEKEAHGKGHSMM